MWSASHYPSESARKCDLRDFDHSMIVSAIQAGFSVFITAILLSFQDYPEWFGLTETEAAVMQTHQDWTGEHWEKHSLF